MPETPATNKRMTYSSRVAPVTVLRLELISAVLNTPIGHLIDQMTALNFKHLQDTGKIADYMTRLEESSEADE